MSSSYMERIVSKLWLLQDFINFSTCSIAGIWKIQVSAVNHSKNPSRSCWCVEIIHKPTHSSDRRHDWHIQVILYCQICKHLLILVTRKWTETFQLCSTNPDLCKLSIFCNSVFIKHTCIVPHVSKKIITPS